MRHDSSQNDTPPLFRADTATLTFAAQKDGKIRVTGYALAKDYLAVLPGEAFVIVCGPQGVEGRIGFRGVQESPADGPDPFWVPDAPSVAPKLPTLSAADIASIKSAGGPVLVAPTSRIGLTYDQTGGE